MAKANGVSVITEKVYPERFIHTAERLVLELGIIDRIIGEPMGGAQRDPGAAIEAVGRCVDDILGQLSKLSREDLVRERRKKFLNMGQKGLAA